MEKVIIKPKYVSTFSCIGPDCEDCCCTGWSIHIDKKNYKKTLANPLFKATAKTALKKIKTDDDHWAEIRMNSQGTCPFLTENHLCRIHAVAGEEALSNACKAFPKTHRIIADDRYESLSLSCPEATRIILFHPEAFMFDCQSAGLASSPPLPLWQSKTYDYSLELLLNDKLNWEQSLLAIGLLIKATEEAKRRPSLTDALDSRYELLSQVSIEGELQQQFTNLPYTPTSQKHAFGSIHRALCQAHPRRKRQRFMLLDEAVKTLSNQENDFGIDGINLAWHEYALPALEQYPDLFERYLLYSIYHDHFPMIENSEPTSAFRLLVLDCFMIRGYLAAMAYRNKGLSEDDIVLCFQVYQVVRRHQEPFIRGVDEIMEQCGLNNVPAAISLLKTCE